MTEHITVSRELLRQALDFVDHMQYPQRLKDALRAALEQPAVEPVAWRYKKEGGGWFVSDNEPQYVEQWNDIEEIVPLYTAPQAQQLAVEPVAEVTWDVDPNTIFIRFLPAGIGLSVGTKLYTAPPPAVVPLLTDDELEEIIAAKSGYGGTNLNAIIRATEQAVRQKAGLK